MKNGFPSGLYDCAVRSVFKPEITEGLENRTTRSAGSLLPAGSLL